ncbi:MULTISPECIES: diacylglycerol kinase family protein [Bacillus]|uniref:diacylglycerol kinase family protein n=1 Tax=Bacillus TaxID=1386 RepID=UPI001D0D4FB3|nr:MULTISPECIES: diacylglycerol kinase family protein [Bacillus]
MDLKDRNKNFRGSLARSFLFALEGLTFVIKNERNIKIHLTLAIIMIGLSYLLQITKIEWIILFLLIGGMIVIEIINTAIENVVDLFTNEYHPLAKISKDVAASAALVYAVMALVVGVFLYTPYLIGLFK